MKTKFSVAGLFAFNAVTLALAQGPLTPPGPPAATMKSLSQIEPRTPISALPFAISSSGSYYLTQNLNVTTGDGITVNANQVTIDLNGFTISSSANPAAGTAILLSDVNGFVDIRIFSGKIRGGVTYSGGTYSGSGFGYGISSFGLPTSCSVESVTVSGCLFDGIALPPSVGAGSNIIRGCSVQSVGGNGLRANLITQSTALLCGDIAIYGSTISDCVGQATGPDVAVTASSATNCTGDNSNSGIGLSATRANNCGGTSQSGIGLNAENATNCFGGSATGIGLNAVVAMNCKGFSGSDKGIVATTAMNCYGESTSNRGISAEIVTGCYGKSGGGSFGINASKLANTSFGMSATGTGLATNIAIGCIGTNNGGASLSANNKYNMP